MPCCETLLVCNSSLGPLKFLVLKGKNFAWPTLDIVNSERNQDVSGLAENLKLRRKMSSTQVQVDARDCSIGLEFSQGK